MAKLILLNKPYQVLSQFTDTSNRSTLADYIPHKHLYPAGRLDYDSEGLLLLTDDGHLQHQISHPKHKLAKTYYLQVEGAVSKEALDRLRSGVPLNDGMTKPAKVKPIAEPELWPRNPPIRSRQNIPTSWIQITIREGKNRQLRRMSAALGFPTLRLIRTQIGSWHLNNLQPGDYKQETVHLEEKKLPPSKRRNRNRQRD